MTTNSLKDFKELFFTRLGRKPNWNIKEIKEELDATERLLERKTQEKKIKCDCGREYIDIDSLSLRRFEGDCEVRVCICGREIIRETKYKLGTPLRNSRG